jgi:acetyl esterase/lipase
MLVGMNGNEATAGGGTRPLADGTAVPVLGLGVWQVRNGRECVNAVRWALEAGYRLLRTGSPVTPEAPPFFVWHTAEDPYVPPEHTYSLAAALTANQVPHAVHVFTHGPHSLGLAQNAGEAAIWTTLARAWIQEQASPSAATSRR